MKESAMEGKAMTGRLIFLAMYAVACINRLIANTGASVFYGVIVEGFVMTCLAAIVPIVLAKNNPRRGYLAAVILGFVFFVFPLVYEFR